MRQRRTTHATSPQKYGLDPQEAAMIAGDIDAAREDAAHFARLADGQSERRLPTQPGRWRTYYETIPLQ